MAKRAKEQIGADEVVFILAKKPRWKSPSAEVNSRLDMLRLAIQSVNGYSISLFEVESDSEINYSIDTVRHFIDNYRNNVELYYLIGFDQVARFPEWKDCQELASICHIIAYSREGSPIDASISGRFHITVINGPIFNVSSTAIRNLHSADAPFSVLNYIVDHGLYLMDKIHTYINGQRLAHSISVAKLAYQIAENNGLDKSKAFVAGLLHDIGKENADNDSAFPDFIMKVSNLPKFSYHQFLGAQIAMKDFEIADTEIIDAIQYHATGKANMSPLGMIIYAADKIEPTRGFDSRELVNACLADYRKGFVAVLSANRDFLLSQKMDIDNPLTKECMKMYIGEKK